MNLSNIKKYYLKVLQSSNSLILHSFSHLYYKNNHPNYLNSIKISNLNKNKIKYLKIIYFLKSFFFDFDNNKENIDKKEIKFIFLSHKLSPKKNEKDIYFGNIKKKIKNKYLTIYINHTNKKSKKLTAENNSIILSKKLNIFFEIYLICKIILFSLLKSKIFKYQKKFSSKIYLINQSLYNLRIYYQLKKILKKNNCKAIFFTYEGYCYERLVCKLSKENKSISCGYQNSTIIKSSHSIYQNYLDDYNPNIVFTASKYNYQLFKKNNKLRKTKVICIGKHSTKKINYSRVPKSNSILVLPEGIYSECFDLFKFSYNFARVYKNVKFIWRIHPIFNWKDIFKLLNIYKFPPNIKISNKNLTNDIQRSKYCLYRGSGAVIEALRNNIIPIYYKKKDELDSIDPLFQFNMNKIENEKELLILIKKFNNNKKFIYEIKKFKKFLDLSFDKININKLKKINTKQYV